MGPFDLVGRVFVAALVLWIGYGVVLLMFRAKVGIPANCPWTIRLQAALMFIIIAGWVLLRHGRVLGGFVMREYDADTGEPVGPCPCPNCVERRANG